MTSKMINMMLSFLTLQTRDMVGHSGMMEPTIKAVEATDECLGKVVEAILAKDGVALITADHGNADQELTLKVDQ